MAKNPPAIPEITLSRCSAHTQQIWAIYECVLKEFFATRLTDPCATLPFDTDVTKRSNPSVICTCHIVLAGNKPIYLCTPYGHFAFPHTARAINQNELTHHFSALVRELGLCKPTNPLTAQKILQQICKLNPHQAMDISVMEVTKTPTEMLATAHRPVIHPLAVLPHPRM